MGFSSKAIAAELIKELNSRSYSQYQIYCRELIADVIPGAVLSKEMKYLDSAGVDIFLINDENDGLAYGFQCKGFEVNYSKERQVDQCRKSIESLNKLTIAVKKYFLLVNRILEREDRIILEAALEKVKSAGKIIAYAILDSQGFIEFLFDHIKVAIEIAINKSNKELYRQYKEKLNQKFYFADVPFELNEVTHKSNPSLYLQGEFQLNTSAGKTHLAHYEPSKYFFVIGDFGFGKTSLMFNSIDSLNGYQALYLPLSLFKKREFQNELEFLMVIYRLITGKEVGLRDLFLKFKCKVLSSIFVNDPRLVLLFDGMDENTYLSTAEGLKLLFSLLQQYKCKIVFSMRKSFWEERQGNFMCLFTTGIKSVLPSATGVPRLI